MGPRFEGRIITWGPIFPEAGPRRSRLLRQEGDSALVDANDAYRLALRELRPTLRAAGCTLPAWAPPVPTAISSLHPKIIERREAYQSLRHRLHRMADPSGENDRTLVLPGADAARRAVARAVDAFNLLEDTERAPEAHALIHKTSELVGGIYGCFIRSRDGAWWDSCPVHISHIRMGMSAGFTARRLCTVCMNDATVCDHVTGEMWECAAARFDDGSCNICGQVECSLHPVGEQFVSRASRVVFDARLHEVSLVPRPRDPLARLGAVEIGADELARRSSRTVRTINRHQDLLCYRCIGECAGFTGPSSGGRERAGERQP